jgi:hypothetical protein
MRSQALPHVLLIPRPRRRRRQPNWYVISGLASIIVAWVGTALIIRAAWVAAGGN